MSGPGPVSRPPAGVHPPLDYPAYRATAFRHPAEPLVIIPQTLSERSGPVFGPDTPRASDADLTRQHAGTPRGRRIVVSGRVLDDRGRPVAGTLVEVWQANAAGRYTHKDDRHEAPLDPNFSGAGRTLTDRDGWYRFVTIHPGPYPWLNHPDAVRPAHVHFSLFGESFLSRLVTQMYFPADPLLAFDPIYQSVPDPRGRARLVAATDPSLAGDGAEAGYRFDLVIRGRAATPMTG